MPDVQLARVRVICAIGQSGQLGLHGAMPWEGHQGRDYIADVERFFALTEGHVVAAGPRTIAAIPEFARRTRTTFVIRSHMVPEEVIAQFAGRVVFIGGGPPVWDAYAHLIEHWDITRLPYDGEADRWFDPNWVVKGAMRKEAGLAG
jgi:dihydromethanopterin reductase